MSISLHDAIGTVGVVLIAGTYLLIQLRRMQVTGIHYSLLNLIGAGLVLYSLSVNFNLSAFIIESFWFLISCIGLAHALRDRLRTRSAAGKSARPCSTYRPESSTRTASGRR